MIDKAKGLLIDWDGCLVVNAKLQPGALDFLASHRERIAIVSNNSTHLPEDLARILSKHGIAFAADRIMLAGCETIRRAVELKPRRVMILGDPRLRAMAQTLGLNSVRDDPDLVILLRDVRFGYARLQRAANALAGGARLLVANADVSHPGIHGSFIPETGALLAALTACAPMARTRLEVLGKPGPTLYRRACAVLGVAAHEAVMIGDNPDTDVAGAEAIGMSAVLVGPKAGFGLDALIPEYATFALVRSV